MGNLLPRVRESKSKYNIPGSMHIMSQVYRLYWFRVDSTPMGNLLPRVGGSNSKYSMPASRLIVTQAYRDCIALGFRHRA